MSRGIKGGNLLYLLILNLMEIKMDETEMKNLNETTSPRTETNEHKIKEWLSRIKTICQLLLLIILVGMLVSSTLFLRQPSQRNDELIQLLYKVMEMPSPIMLKSFESEHGNGSSYPRVVFKD